MGLVRGLGAVGVGKVFKLVLESCVQELQVGKGGSWGRGWDGDTGRGQGLAVAQGQRDPAVWEQLIWALALGPSRTLAPAGLVMEGRGQLHKEKATPLPQGPPLPPQTCHPGPHQLPAGCCASVSPIAQQGPPPPKPCTFPTPSRGGNSYPSPPSPK